MYKLLRRQYLPCLSRSLKSSPIDIFESSPAQILFDHRQTNSSSVPVLFKHVQQLTKLIRECPRFWSPDEASKALIGLQHFNHQDERSQALFTAIVEKAVETPKALGGIQDLKYSLEGSQYFQAPDLTLEALHFMLNRWLQDSPEPISNANIAFCFLTLAHQDIGRETTKELFRLLVSKMETSTEMFTVSEFSDILYSLRNHDRCHDVHRVLAYCTQLLANQEEPLPQRELAKCCCALQNLNISKQISQDFLATLTNHIEQSEEAFTEETMLTILKHCRLFTGHETEINNFLGHLSVKMDMMEGEPSSELLVHSFLALQNRSEKLSGALCLFESATNKLLNYKGEKLSCHQLCSMLYGARKLSNAVISVPYFLREVCCRLSEVDVLREPITAESISLALNGMQSLNLRGNSVRTLIVTLQSIFENCEEDFSPDQIALALQGFQNFEGNFLDVTRIIKLLATKIRESPQGFTENTIAAMSGLRCMSLNNYGAAVIFRELGLKIAAYKRPISPYAISCALSGLASVDMTEPTRQYYYVEHLILTLAQAMRESREPFTQAHIVACMECLKHLDYQSEFIRTLLMELTEKMKRTSFKFRVSDVILSLYSCCSMSSDDEAVRRYLREVNKAIRTSSDPMNLSECARALYGMRCMDSAVDEVQDILSYIVGHLTSGPITVLRTRDVHLMAAGIRKMNLNHPNVSIIFRYIEDGVYDYFPPMITEEMYMMIVHCLEQLTPQTSKVQDLLAELEEMVEFSDRPRRPRSRPSHDPLIRKRLTVAEEPEMNEEEIMKQIVHDNK